jgi:phospholipid N-methyltransferase
MDIIKFMFCYMDNPSSVGSLIPSSSRLGKEIALAIKDFDTGTVLLEFGAGSGAITKYLPPNAVSVEIDKNFVALLKQKFPDRKIVELNAIEMLSEIKEPVNIVSSIPLIKNSYAGELREAIKRANSANLIKNLITYSYGYNPPMSNCGFESGTRLNTVFFNVPPANIWKYR